MRSNQPLLCYRAAEITSAYPKHYNPGRQPSRDQKTMAADCEGKHSQPLRLIWRLYDETDDENDRHNEEGDYAGSHDFEHFACLCPLCLGDQLSDSSCSLALPNRRASVVACSTARNRRRLSTERAITAKNGHRFGAVCQNEEHKNWIGDLQG
jgi:hypothetical protein